MGARIPEFVTRTLASGLTGTIGVQTSGERLFSDIAQAGASVFSVSTSILAERKRVMDTVEADAKAREFEAQIDVSTQASQTKFSKQPRLGVKEANNEGALKLSEFLNTIEDSQVKGLVSSRASTILRANSTAMKRWANDQEVKNTANNFTMVDNIDAGALRLNPSMEAFIKSIARHEGRVDQANKIFSASQVKSAMDRGRESRAKGVLHGFMQQDPVKGAQLLKTGVFDAFMSSDDIEKFTEKMKKKIKGRAVQIKFDNMLNTLKQFEGAEEALNNAELTIDMVDGMEIEIEETGRMTPTIQAAINDLRDVAAENRSLTSINDDDTIINLNDELRSLNVSADKRDANANLEKLFQFRANVLKASKNNSITPKMRKSLLNHVVTPIGDKIADAGADRSLFGIPVPWDLFGSPNTPHDVGYLKINNWLDDMGFSDTIHNKDKAKMLTDMLTEIEEARGAGQVINNTLVDEIAQRQIVRELQRQNSKLINIPPEGKRMRLRNGQKVLVMPDGTITPIN